MSLESVLVQGAPVARGRHPWLRPRNPARQSYAEATQHMRFQAGCDQHGISSLAHARAPVYD